MENEKLTGEVKKAVEMVIFKYGKEVKKIYTSDNKKIFSFYECKNKREKVTFFAVIGHPDAFKPFTVKKCGSCLLCLSTDKEKMENELIDLIVTYELQVQKKSA